MQNESVIQGIISLLFGHKYYAVIINTRGTDKQEVCSEIHKTMESAEEHRKRIGTTMSFEFVEIVSFRSHKEY